MGEDNQDGEIGHLLVGGVEPRQRGERDEGDGGEELAKMVPNPLAGHDGDRDGSGNREE